MTNTNTNKKLGIYIDYTNAYLMELIGENIVSRNIEFEPSDANRMTSPFKKSDSIDSETEYHLQTAYYLEICEIIRNYN